MSEQRRLLVHLFIWQTLLSVLASSLGSIPGIGWLSVMNIYVGILGVIICCGLLEDFLKCSKYEKITSVICQEYIDLLNSKGIDSEEVKTFRAKFQDNPEFLKLLDTAKVLKAMYATLPKTP